jgi:curved DNA-binding protein CbpA
MADPYEILGIAQGASETEIRSRYLELVREHPPDRDPERFAAVREAYEQLRDPVTRMRTALFKLRDTESIPSILADARRRVRRMRLSTSLLLTLADRR